jgi:hypothetical protein
MGLIELSIVAISTNIPTLKGLLETALLGPPDHSGRGIILVDNKI